MSLATAIAGAFTTLQSMGGVTVTCRRGGDTASLTAVKSVHPVELDGGDGTTVAAERTDWLIEAADYVFGGQATEPQDGDRIEQVIGSETHVYEAMPLGTEACYRRTDSHGQAFRVHTKLVEVQ